MKEKVLFVDDEQCILDAFRRQFHSTFEVRTALGGHAGLEMIASDGPFVVVVADMRMPKMNGIEFLQRARVLDDRVVLMMLTGNADRQTAVDAVEQVNVFQFLTKPCSEKDLKAAINSGIELYNLQGKIDRIQDPKRKAA